MLLCKATYDKTKECLQKEKSRQVRKRKHEERVRAEIADPELFRARYEAIIYGNGG